MCVSKHSRDLRSPRDTYLHIVCSAKDVAILGNAKGSKHIIACICDQKDRGRKKEKNMCTSCFKLMHSTADQAINDSQFIVGELGCRSERLIPVSLLRLPKP